MTQLELMGQKAKEASRSLGILDTESKNAALLKIADALEENGDQWLKANEADLENAKNNGMKQSLIDRLALTKERIKGVAQGVRDVARLRDPVGETIGESTRPNGLLIKKQRVPLGVIGIIYEARPNVTVDAAALCLKSGNACILRGGKEAIHSNMAAVKIMRGVLASLRINEDSINLIEDTSRESASELMHLNAYVDVLIPRGGAGLIRAVTAGATVPVIRTGEGVCHVYVDRDADLDMAAKILFNAKCSRPSVCNAAECVLVHKDVQSAFWEKALPLLKTKNVLLRADEEALKVLGENAEPADEDDWDKEYGDYTLAVRTVSGVDEAIDFIALHGTQHSECIVTQNERTAQEFLLRTDAAAVYHNASTRFTDGGEFGLGAEIGISTQKLHARGPMGLEEMTSWKYVVLGNGQVR